MSDTPRTDAQVEWVTFRPGPIQAMADFARTLERELAALRADKERLVEAIIKLNARLQCGVPYTLTPEDIDDLRAAIEVARKAAP